MRCAGAAGYDRVPWWEVVLYLGIGMGIGFGVGSLAMLTGNRLLDIRIDGWPGILQFLWLIIYVALPMLVALTAWPVSAGLLLACYRLIVDI